MTDFIKKNKEKIEFLLKTLTLIFILYITNLLFLIVSYKFKMNTIVGSFDSISYMLSGMSLLLLFLFSIFKNNLFSYIFISIFAFMFSIDRYFSVLVNDKFFQVGITLNNLDIMFDLSNSYKILLDYISFETILYFILFFLTFVFIMVLTKFLIKKYVKFTIENIKNIENRQFVFVFIFIFLFIPLTKNYIISPFQFRTFSTFVVYFENNLFPVKKDKINKIKYNNDNYKNILIVIDESIQYEYFKMLEKDLEITNYINLSPTIVTLNCSYGSKKTFLKGSLINGNASDIFDYAKNLNYDRYFLDAQSSYYNTGFTFKDKDLFQKEYIGGEVNNRDNKLFLKIKNIFNNNNNNKIIYMHKFGSHFNYKDSYKLKNIEINTTNLRKKEYLSSIKYNSIDFLNKINNLIKDTNSIVFYISDHGQNDYFLEDKNLGSSHCDGNKYSYRVPSLIFGNNSKQFNKYITKKKEYYSLDMFGMILISMGYEPEDVQRYYKLNTKEGKYLISDMNDQLHYW